MAQCFLQRSGVTKETFIEYGLLSIEKSVDNQGVIYNNNGKLIGASGSMNIKGNYLHIYIQGATCFIKCIKNCKGYSLLNSIPTLQSFTEGQIIAQGKVTSESEIYGVMVIK